MSTSLYVKSAVAQTTRPRVRRSVAELLEPLEIIAASSVGLIANHGARFEVNGEQYELPRYLYVGPKGGDDPIRIGIFSTLHGDEPEGAHALVQFVRLLERSPEIARGYCLFLYPVCNPTGYEDGTRCSRRGRDLNREFWNHSVEPEIQLLQSELCSHAFDGIIALHSDDTSHGAYGFVSGSTLTKNLLEPALAAANDILPRNDNAIIDGFNAQNGVIREGYQGVLSAPPKIRPRPFEIVFETPQEAPHYAQVQATVVALTTILGEYRKFISYAANL
jgi:murein peptide amidase A